MKSSSRVYPKWTAKVVIWLFWFVTILQLTRAQESTDLWYSVTEGQPPGTFIGNINTDSGVLGPYFISPASDQVLEDLQIDQNDGEIRTKIILNRENSELYEFFAISMSNHVIQVTVVVIDANDNTPQFPSPVSYLEISEASPIGSKRTIDEALDNDAGIFNTQRYEIISGNVDGAFRLDYRLGRDQVLYLDLIVDNHLDRETTPRYELLIHAVDGGDPPKTGSTLLNITITDTNDNQPVFNQSRYSASIAETASVGSSILQVYATDIDEGTNGAVSYDINRRQSDPGEIFRVDAKTGVLYLNKELNYEDQPVHELIVEAKDNGTFPERSTAFVTVHVGNINENPPEVTILFLGSGNSEVSENARPGDYVARISVFDPDEGELTNVNVTLRGGDGHFGIEMVDNIIYLVCVKEPLDREARAIYEMSVIAADHGVPPLYTEKPLVIHVADINDNAPHFDQSVYYASVIEVADPGTSVFQLHGTDSDAGINAQITYKIIHVTNSFSNWFQIDTNSGLITTATDIDREQKPSVTLHIMAQDGGAPTLATNVTVIISIRDVNDNEPSFDNSFYNASVLEDAEPGFCIVQVSASDLDADEFGRVTYSIGQGFGSSPPPEFVIRGDSGWICTTMGLDRDERGSSYQFPVQAVDGGGLNSITMVKITVLDVNDNRPVFYPQTYAVDVDEDSPINSDVVTVAATDKDAGAYGLISYQIVNGNNNALFSIHSRTGVIRLIGSLNRQQKAIHELAVSATDGGGRTSLINAEVSVSVIGSEDVPPVFDRSSYSFAVREDEARFSVIGTVHAAHTDSGNHDSITYTIHSGDPNGYFYLHPTTGVLSINSALDYEAHPYILLNIQASSGNPPSHGRAQVNMTIIDINDNSPEFARTVDVKSVPETLIPGTVFYVAMATDRDSGSNGKVQYRLVNDFSGLFSINTITGQIQALQALDYDTQNKYELIVEASDKGTPRRSSNLTLNVYVQDMNDNGPQFYPASYEVSVSEDLPVGDEVLHISATDGDLGSNARITYKLKPGPYTANFGIFPDTGIMYTRKGLDREMMSDYVLEVEAKDNGTPPQSATATIVIHVQDVNDNTPKMTQESYYFSISENELVNTVVGTVSATDKDQGTNAQLSYQIDTNDNFDIDPSTGVVTTKTVLDREEKSNYELTVTVSDNGNIVRESKAMLYITVEDQNDNAPKFCHEDHYVASILEDQPANTQVIKVSAKDPDNADNGVVSYHIVTGDELNGVSMFKIDETTGDIRTRASLDREVKDTYVLSVAARDHGSPPRETINIVYIEVLDENDNSPKFVNSTYSFTVEENTPPRTSVGQVRAYDADIGNNGLVLYYIIDGDPFGTFEVNRTTGVIFTIDYTDYELSPSYVLIIQASDMNIRNPRRTTTTVHIYIIDLNDNAPVFENDPILFKVKENVPIGYSAYTFTATDADSGNNAKLKYFLTRHSGNRTVFEINADTGELTTIDYVDREETGDYSLVIQAEDQPDPPEKPLFGTTTARIFIEDENDNSPRFTSRNITYIMEDEPLEYPVMHIVALDPDYGDNGRVVYDIAYGNEAGKFSIEHDTGLLILVDPLDRELVDQYALNISAADSGVPPRVSFQLLLIYVGDVNDNAPQFVSDGYSMAVSENQGAAVFVGQVNATDDDIGTNGEITYSIPEDIADNMFWINSTTGEIYTSDALDREATPSYIVTVYASDNAFPALYDTTTVSVTVLDENDHAPVFASDSYSISVPENGPATELHVVAASDADEGSNAEIRYYITNGNTNNDFVVDEVTGVLATASALDREMLDNYELEITAQDMASNPLSSSMTVTVSVVDLNDNAPEFQNTPYDVSISEDLPIDSTVLTVSATDADLGTNADILFTLESLTVNMFRIDNINGEITSVREFDRETTAEFLFEVNATDGSVTNPLSSATQVHVIITDINDNAPIFTSVPFTANVSSTIPVDSVILQLSAVDRDEGTNAEITYSLEGSSTYFDVLGDGRVKVKDQLPNTDQVYRLDVKATDHGVPALSSEGIAEIRVNNAMPELHFENEIYNERIDEHSSAETSVIIMMAELQDYQPSTTFDISHGNENGAFSIDQNTGEITVQEPDLLDREKIPKIRLAVSAQRNTNQFGYTTVWVNLDDINDNPPIFVQEKYATQVWENEQRSTFVIQVSASDEDIGENADITYSIIEGNNDNAFSIDSQTGVVSTSIILDREIHDMYRLKLQAVDRDDDHALTGTATLRIKIVDVNDNKPSFNPHSGVKIQEGAEVGSMVTVVSANDADADNILSYDFADGGNPDGKFSIDKFSGTITLAAALDYEERQEYILNIRALDSIHIASLPLDVTVEDENDNAPEFTQPSYEADVLELTPGDSSILTVNATDRDSGSNAEIRYSMDVTPVPGFRIDAVSGVIYSTERVVFNPNQPTVRLIVKATDQGVPPLSSVVAVLIEVIDLNDHAPEFDSDLYIEDVSEGEPKGYVVVSVHATDADHARENKEIDYRILAGNIDNMFEVSPNSGNIAVMGNLDRETLDMYELTVEAADRGQPKLTATTTVVLTVTDINDHAPVFNASSYEGTISEGVPRGTSIVTVYATDEDEGTNALVRYEITSGNELDLFIIGHYNGSVAVKGRLDHDTQNAVHRLSIVATDSSVDNPRHSVTSAVIYVTDENDHAPFFPVLMYLESLPEEEPVGTYIFTAHAIDNDRGSYGILTYSIKDEDNEDSEFFEIDSKSGDVTSQKKFDFERDKREYVITIQVVDTGGKDATVRANIAITGIDEYEPVFTMSLYDFIVPANAEIGDVVGQVHATDQDAGADGFVLYYFDGNYPNFRMNETHGYITVEKSFLEEERKKRDVNNATYVRSSEESTYNLDIIARSGKPKSLQGQCRSVVVVDYKCDTCPGSSPATGPALSGLPLALVIVFAIIAGVTIIVVIIIVVTIYVRKKQSQPPAPNPPPDGAHTAQSYEHDMFDPIVMSPNQPEHHLIDPPPNGTLPAMYSMNDPRHISRMHSPNTSMEVGRTDVSDQSNSTSSGRGSASVEDEEIRMINEKSVVLDHQSSHNGRRMPDSGIQQDEDAISDLSVNEQSANQVLRSLGVNVPKTENLNKILNQSVESMHIFGDEGGGEERGVDLGTFIDAKLHEVGAEENNAIMDGTRTFGMGDDGQPSMAGSLSSIVNSDEEFSGSYNWDYLLDWGPQFQPLANVFAEIAKLKDESIAKKQLEDQRSNHRQKHSLSPKVKNFPPPLLTTVAHGPVAPIQPIAISMNQGRINQSASANMFPRSPISPDSNFTSPAMSPNFSPSLSPLANRTPSISPMVTPMGISTAPSSAAESSASTPQRSPRSSTILTFPSMSGADQEVTI